MNPARIVIVGASPIGLGATYRLHEIGYDNWALYEKSDHVGGHATSHVDDKGFLCDEGGHVIFSQYPYFDRLIDEALGQDCTSACARAGLFAATPGCLIPFKITCGTCPRTFRFVVMCEASIPNGESVDVDRVWAQLVAGLIRAGMLESSDKDRVVSRYDRLVEYSYPIPTLDRDKALDVIQPALISQGIYSRGRFGAGRYEIGNMDHSVMMGVEAVNHALQGEKENVFRSA